MVADRLENAGRYVGLHKNITAALNFIQEHEKDIDLQDGTYEVIPGEVIIHVVTKDTHAREEARMELHKKFMDIHYILQGAERCGIASLPEELTVDYDSETDNGFWDCEDSYDVRIGEGEFCMVWPLEPHCPLCYAEGKKETIRKMIGKIKVDK